MYILDKLKKTIKKIPIISSFAMIVYFKLLSYRFGDSQKYWENNYKNGGNSGPGSYDKLAVFKATILNSFVKNNVISSVIEYGSGDGNNLKLSIYPKYIGFDISTDAIALCKNLFAQDSNKLFKLTSEYSGECADLTISLDVIYHLVEDATFESYMKRLFMSANKFVIIYSSNFDKQEKIQPPHVKHRFFTNWVDKNMQGWKLIQYIPNQHPLCPQKKEGSFANFYIYEKK